MCERKIEGERERECLYVREMRKREGERVKEREVERVCKRRIDDSPVMIYPKLISDSLFIFYQVFYYYPKI